MKNLFTTSTLLHFRDNCLVGAGVRRVRSLFSIQVIRIESFHQEKLKEEKDKVTSLYH